MRKNYFEILDDFNLDIKLELAKLHGLIKENFWANESCEMFSLYALISGNFRKYIRRK